MSDKTNPSQTVTIDTDSIASRLMENANVNWNIAQEVIITTEDKVRICLLENLKRIERKSGWMAPLGILIAIFTTLTTTTFNNVLLDSSTWRAIFLLVGGASLIWLIISVVQALCSKKVDDVVIELKKGSKKILDDIPMEKWT
jgi:Flp pilus assembly protein TadB